MSALQPLHSSLQAFSRLLGRVFTPVLFRHRQKDACQTAFLALFPRHSPVPPDPDLPISLVSFPSFHASDPFPWTYPYGLHRRVVGGNGSVLPAVIADGKVIQVVRSCRGGTDGLPNLIATNCCL